MFTNMETVKSQDEVHIIATLLSDISMSLGQVFNTRTLRLDLQKIEARVRSEGVSFLTKTLPKLGKAFDKAISGGLPLNAAKHGFKPMPGCEYPRFLGTLFSRVLDCSGALLPNPCATSVRAIREILYLYYKYELPYSSEQEREVVSKFVKTENDLQQSDVIIQQTVSSIAPTDRRRKGINILPSAVLREARILLSRVFADFNPQDIFPKHGPGAVATRQQLWGKYIWSNISSRITEVYPVDEYFYSSPLHFLDNLCKFPYTETTYPAKVILVPKDSRGPRLISCEPVDFQWIQQGLSRAIVAWVERHPLTRENVRFTDQAPNGFAALEGSRSGRYATLDLNEASDRVSLELVRSLFPPHIVRYLEACRTSETTLPDGTVLPLRKFAPMGSALCFPVLALTVWSLLSAGVTCADTIQSIYVYGDDVIVPTAYAGDAIERLESFGLKVNRDKSCTGGLFRESCGVDAFKGSNVTPVRLRTVWSSSQCPDVYTSWIAYANSFYDRGYYRTYDYIVSRLVSVYGYIPGEERRLTVPSLREEPNNVRPPRQRFNRKTFRLEFKVWCVKSPIIHYDLPGWEKLLRFFTETSRSQPAWLNRDDSNRKKEDFLDLSLEVEHGTFSGPDAPFCVSQYTKRGTSMLVSRWR